MQLAPLIILTGKLTHKLLSTNINYPNYYYYIGFMTAVMQTYARAEKIAIDTLIFRTELRDFFEDDIKIVPKVGKLNILLCLDE